VAKAVRHPYHIKKKGFTERTSSAPGSPSSPRIEQMSQVNWRSTQPHIREKGGALVGKRKKKKKPRVFPLGRRVDFPVIVAREGADRVCFPRKASLYCARFRKKRAAILKKKREKM